MPESTLPPDYFRTAAELFKAKPTDRKAWLSDQVAKANLSLSQYQKELAEIAVAIVKLGGAPSDAKVLTIVGGVIGALPTGYTQVIGGVLMIAGAFFAKAENKQKQKEIARLAEIGSKRNEEASKVAVFKTRYERELMLLRMIPVVLTAIIILIILI